MTVFRCKVLAACLALPLPLLADTGNAPDIERFVEIADTCLHLAGEWDSALQEMHARAIEDEANTYCTRAKKQYRALLIQYKHAPEVIQRLRAFEYLNAVSE